MNETPATKSSQRLRVMQHLKEGKTLTSLEALRLYGIMRLPNRISELRRRGEQIEKTTITVENKYGEAVRVAEYRLKADNVELFNLMNGAAFLPRSERDAHPNAEYFTAEISPEHVGKVLEGLESDEVKSVTLTFRKLVTVKDGEIVDITKSGEKVKAVAIEDGGKMFLRVGAAAMGENVVGVLVRIAISLKGVKE